MIFADICKLPGLILPLWGTDHYLQSGWDARSLAAGMLQSFGQALNLIRPVEMLEMRSC